MIENLKKPEMNIPEWLTKKEEYIHKADKDSFLDKSILSLFRLLSRIQKQDKGSETKIKINVAINILCTFSLLILVSVTKSFLFVLIIGVYLLLRLSMQEADHLVRVLKTSFAVTFLTAVVMLPAFLMGSGYSSIMVTSKVLVSITAVGLLSQTARWNAMTSALKAFFIPDLFILILDITIKYMYMLGELSLNLFYALKLRSVGKNNKKYTSMAGIAGTVFLESKEMAEEMYHAMECRGFTGEYSVRKNGKFTWADGLYCLIHAGFLALFFYFYQLYRG